MLRTWFILLCAATCFAQAPAPGETAQAAPSPKTPHDIVRGIIDDAHATPVEIFADIVLRRSLLAYLTKEEQIQALADAFYRADEAHAAVPMRYFGVIAQTTTQRERDRSAAFSSQFDALSIRSQAVKQLIPLDAKKARELFEAMPPLNEPKGDCSQSYIPDASIYFETLAAVAGSNAFTGEERKKEAPFLMVERCARSAESAWDIIAAAQNLASLAHGEKEAGMLESALAASLGISDSDRSFTNAVRGGFFAHRVLAARETLQKQGAPGIAILEALRGFLSRHLTGVRCRENAGETDAHDYEVEEFDAALGDRSDIAPLGDGLKPSALEDSPAPEEYANETEYEALQAEERPLIHFSMGFNAPGMRITLPNPNTAPDPDAPPASADDQEFRARQLLYKIDDFSGAPGQDPVEVFHQKCTLLRTLLGSPLDADTERAVESEALAVLEDSVILNRSPLEWRAEFQSFEGTLKMRDDYNTGALGGGRQGTGRPAAEGYPAPSDPKLYDLLVHSTLLAISVYGRIDAFRAAHPPAAPAPQR